MTGRLLDSTTCRPHKDGNISFSFLSEDATSKIPNFFSLLSFSCLVSIKRINSTASFRRGLTKELNPHPPLVKRTLLLLYRSAGILKDVFLTDKVKARNKIWGDCSYKTLGPFLSKKVLKKASLFF